ncbi:MAG: ABC transporter permease [Bdellovibrionales bacterium]
MWSLAWKSLRHRRLTVGLTTLCVTLSVVLLLSLERIKQASEDGFIQTVSQVDLLVGPRGGSLQLLLFTVFNVGQPMNTLSWKTYETWKNHPAVEWTIPYSLGDSFRGFRVVGTDHNFFEHYRYRGQESISFHGGRKFESGLEVVLGWNAARDLKLKVGDSAVITHGVTHGPGVLHHDENPFQIVGIMKPTGTALDHAVYVSLESMDHLHPSEMPNSGPAEESTEASHEHEHDHAPADSQASSDVKTSANAMRTLNSFFVRCRSRMDTLKLQRGIAESKGEPLMAIIPAMVLAELWKNLGYFEKILRLLILLVAVFSWVTLMLVMMAGLEARRREMALFRAQGASASWIFRFLAIEALLIGCAGALLGLALSRLSLLFLESWLQEAVGLSIAVGSLTLRELLYLLLIIVGCGLVSLVPGLRARRQVLKDGLAVKL